MRNPKVMDSSYNFPQDDYALAILTHAAMQTTHTSETSSPSYSGSRINVPSLTRADGRGSSSTTTISNHQNDDRSDHNLNNSSASNLSHSRTPDLLSEYNTAGPSSRSMETLGFNQTHSRQNPYMNAGYHGIGAQISANYASTLGILNAESYDDGRGTIRDLEQRQSRLHQMSNNAIPFGMVESNGMGMGLEVRANSEEFEKRTKRRKKRGSEAQNEEDDDEARKKARGRPRVDTKDETAADRRRTQIRMAQRAYRHRKETTITSLEKQVQDHKSTNEEMSNVFLNLYDFAVSKGLMQREPEFGQQLKSTLERFTALAKATTAEDASHEEGHESGTQEAPKADSESGLRRKYARTSPKKAQEEAPASKHVQPWGGYFAAKDESPVEEIPLDFGQQNFEHRTRGGDVQVITRPTEDNASFPFDFMDLQQYRVELPPPESYSENIFSQSQLPLPTSYNYHELSFARRIHRGAAEYAFKLVTLENPPEERFNRVFGFCLLYETKESIKARLENTLGRSTKEPLSNWRAPFVHVGGAGTYYPMQDSDVTGDLMPKFRTGYSMGPFTPSIAQADQAVQDMRCNVPGFEGKFFDPNDVEGYLRGRGLDIPPAADFVTAEIDLSALGEVSTPKSTHSGITASTKSPKTPQSPVDRILINSYSYKVNPDTCREFPFPIGYAEWDSDVPVTKESNIDPIFTTVAEKNPSGQMAKTTKENQNGDKRRVTINVEVLLHEILSHGVCLGRAPGFRLTDINAAIIAAVKAGF